VISERVFDALTEDPDPSPSAFHEVVRLDGKLPVNLSMDE